MAGPIAGAGAISAVLLSSARAILGPKKTAEYAIKGAKFLSNQVEKARKLMNKPTAGQIKAEVPTKGTRAYAKGQAKAVGGTAAVTVPVGVAAYVSKGRGVTNSNSKTPSKTPSKTNKNKPTTARGTPANNKPAAKKGPSPFEKAFSEARKRGVKTFTYKGDVYNTKLKTKVSPPKKKK